MMTKAQCLLHLLKVCDHWKHVAHYQAVARYVLESLRIDNRIDETLYAEVSVVIASGNLLEHDRLLIDWQAEQDALKQAQVKKPEQKKLFVSIRPKPRNY